MNNELEIRIKNYLTHDYASNVATKDEIETAERDLNVTFSQDYIEFIKLFGGCYVGVSIYAFKNSRNMEKSTIVELTKSFRQDGWPHTNENYVISIDGMGNPVMVDKEGKVVVYDHDSGSLLTLANSLEELIDENLPL